MTIEQTIEDRLADVEPSVEVVMVERHCREGLCLYIDHPDGVSLELCERVTNHLRDLLTHHSLTVSSPGADRPLTKPEHFRRFLGRRVRVRTREAVEGRKSFTGTLVSADEKVVDVDVDDDADQITIPLHRIHRSNLVPELPGGTS
ncbi:MAG: ribosome maturation factor RimP [Solirubrobacterales bacterium]